MKILFYDFMQNSDAPEELTSPALSDAWEDTSVTVTLDESRTFDCVGIGYTDATEIIIDGETITISDPSPYPDSYKNGLYLLAADHTAQEVVISHNGTYIGRVALGLGRSLGCSPSQEPGFWTTASSRETLSAQIIPGAGGVSGRKQGVKITYKFTEEICQDIMLAYPEQISKSFPLFTIFDKESHRFLWTRFYGMLEEPEIVFQSSVNRKLFSRSFTLLERY